MPLPSSGDGCFLGQKPGTNKIKTSLASSIHSDSKWDIVDSKKSSKSNINNNKVNKSALSPNLQHIIDNHPTLNFNDSVFTYDKASTSNPITPDSDTLMSDPPDNNTIGIDNVIPHEISQPVSVIPNTKSISHQIDAPDNTFSNRTSDQHLKHFEDHFEGSPIIIIESTDNRTTNGSWHPLKWAKFLCNNFFGINCIKPNGHGKVKVSFDSIFHANTCLDSPLLSVHNLSAYIPSTLIFSHGIIKLDTRFPEEEFREGLNCCVPVIEFKRISSNRDGIRTPTRIVELKFLSPKIPPNLSIFNMLFDVSPSIRSPLQCNNCLRFGHTSNFCRSSPRCSHCGDNKHSISTCPSVQATNPCCLFCQGSHLATDRSCREWDFQRDVKKIMATENLSFKDAFNFKKRNQVSSAFSFSNIVNKQPTVSPPIIPSSPTHQSSSPSSRQTSLPHSLQLTSFPTLPSNNSHKLHKKPRYRSPFRAANYPNIPAQNNFSLPNGSFLRYASNNTSNSETSPQNTDFTWINTLALKLSESLLNSPNLSAHTATSLQNIIESSILSLLPARCPSVQHLLASSKCSVALISETWLSPSRNFHIPHFNIFRADQLDGYGGTAIATYSSLKVRSIELNPYLQRVFSINKIDIVGIEVLNIKNHPSISFWSCYIPGDSTISLDVWDSLFKLGTNNFFFGGDFNAHHPAWGHIYPSRYNSPNSAIDISFSSPNLIWSTTWHTLTDPHGSDHFPIIITFNYNTHNRGHSSILQDTPSPTLQFNLNQADWNQFSQTISNNMSPIEATICPLEAYNQFCQLILTAAKQSILHKNQTKENFAPSPPWWDSNCTQAIKLRKHLFKIYRRSGSPSDYYNYNNSCAATTRLLKNKKRIAWKQFCSNLNPSSSLQDLWKTAKRFRKCIQPSTHTLNDDWFEDFCAKVAPCYLPSESESSPSLIELSTIFPPDLTASTCLSHRMNYSQQLTLGNLSLRD
ncbi:hypothetical protein QTP88_012271 [Uroleucon formosanum]